VSQATEIMQARIDYLTGTVADLQAAIVHRDHQLNRLRKILVRINGINDNPAHFCKEIDDMTMEFVHRHLVSTASKIKGVE
jgi:hypothetical protein